MTSKGEPIALHADLPSRDESPYFPRPMLSLMTVQWSQWLGATAPVTALLGLAGQNADDHPSKALPIILGVIFGAFCGAIVGMILARLIRFIAYMAGGDFEGNRLVFVCTLIGAGLFAWLAAK